MLTVFRPFQPMKAFALAHERSSRYQSERSAYRFATIMFRLSSVPHFFCLLLRNGREMMTAYRYRAALGRMIQF